MLRTRRFLALGFLGAASIANASLLDDIGEAAGAAVSVVGDTVENAGSAISADDESPALLREKIDQSAAEAIERLKRESTGARERYEHSRAYAVFDTRKFSLMITTGLGSGVAIDKESGKRVYMKMATGGVNLGYGLQSFQVVFLFPDHGSFTDFIENGWSADASATAAANENTAGAGLQLENGVTVYTLNEKGIALSATLTGTKYWKDDELNQ